jgi:hypothetical protein
MPTDADRLSLALRIVTGGTDVVRMRRCAP